MDIFEDRHVREILPFLARPILLCEHLFPPVCCCFRLVNYFPSFSHYPGLYIRFPFFFLMFFVSLYSIVARRLSDH